MGVLLVILTVLLVWAVRIAYFQRGDVSRGRYPVAGIDVSAHNGAVDFAQIDALPLEQAREQLKTIVGVGDKVADCVLLFALEHADAFPKDVWIKRAMQVLFDGELPDCATPYAGITQQYIFLYARETKLAID